MKWERIKNLMKRYTRTHATLYLSAEDFRAMPGVKSTTTNMLMVKESTLLIFLDKRLPTGEHRLEEKKHPIFETSKFSNFPSLKE